MRRGAILRVARASVGVASVAAGCGLHDEVIGSDRPIEGAEAGAESGGPSIAGIPDDRRIPWAPGIPGGIPARSTICATIDATRYGNGSTDATSAIEDAVRACPPGQVVYLPPGTYLVSGNVLVTSSIVLRGAGPGATKLLVSADVYVQPGALSFETTSWTSGYDKGTTEIALASTSGLAVGQEILLDEMNDPALVHPGSPAPWCRRTADAATGGTADRAAPQIVHVTAIDGVRVTIDPPLYVTHDAARAPQAFTWRTPTAPGSLRQVGIEELTVDGKNGDPDRVSLLNFQFCSQCWVKHVELANFGLAGVSTDHMFQFEIRESYFHDSAQPPNGRNRTALRLDTTSATLVEDNVFVRTVNAVILQCPSSGSVVAYNYMGGSLAGSSAITDTIQTYAAHNHMNLFEGNIVPSIVLADEFGSGSHQTLFRNLVSGDEPGTSAAEVPVQIYAWNRFSNVVGNVLGTAGYHDTYDLLLSPSSAAKPIYAVGFVGGDVSTTAGGDPVTVQTLLRHGNFDVVTNAVTWSAADHALPASLYLSSKPARWGALPWPAIGPDVSPMAGTIPAKVRFARGAP